MLRINAAILKIAAGFSLEPYSSLLFDLRVSLDRRQLGIWTIIRYSAFDSRDAKLRVFGFIIIVILMSLLAEMTIQGKPKMPAIFIRIGNEGN